MADIAVQQPSNTGATLTMGAAATGDKAVNPKGRLMLQVANGDASPHTLTIPAVTTTRAAEGQFPAMTVPDIVVAVPAGATKLIGPIPNAYNDANNKITTNYSATTSMTLAAIEAP